MQEVTIEDAGMRVTVRRTARTRPALNRSDAATFRARSWSRCSSRPPRRAWFASRRRWSARSTGRPSRARTRSSSVGDVVVPGQTLCILEAMKLMNEVKVEQPGIVRAIHAENAQPVEYGQLLFELELADGRVPVL